MASKRSLSAADQQRFRELLQSATIGALMDSRRWEPGDLAFQGGTCLHLAHGSARFSEDLDFMVRGGLSLVGLSREVQRRLQHLPGVPADMAVTVSDARDNRNPHAFMVTLGGPGVIGSAKVKIELWSTSQEAMQSLKLLIKSIPSPTGAQAFVPTLALNEVLADKVYALGARERIKPRDIFDLWWLSDQKAMTVDADALIRRLAIYPLKDGDQAQTATRWLASAREHLDRLRAPRTAAFVSADLARWLPSSWKMDPVVAASMTATSASLLERGLEIMEAAYPPAACARPERS
ncbi:MAG: nucleotidyl transferase AbiEii/AbiGii toxin family protein [Burkholderiaceae bacterium]